MLISMFFFVSCKDGSLQLVSKEKVLTETQWYIHTYVDGVDNTLLEMEYTEYDFRKDGSFTKSYENGYSFESTWEFKDSESYLRIGGATFKINRLTRNVLSLEYGQDAIYFLPVH